MRFAGYAALFHIADASGDIIEHGAFADTLAARGEPFPLLWQHRPDQVIGTIEQIAEDAKGLRIIGSITAVNSRGAKALESGNVSGLSFGYRARSARCDRRNRRLLAIDLFEISLVTHPLQHGARVHMLA